MISINAERTKGVQRVLRDEGIFFENEPHDERGAECTHQYMSTERGKAEK